MQKELNFILKYTLKKLFEVSLGNFEWVDSNQSIGCSHQFCARSFKSVEFPENQL